jgi:hypothetical protein
LHESEGPSSRWTLPQYQYGLSSSCSCPFVHLPYLSFSSWLTSPSFFFSDHLCPSKMDGVEALVASDSLPHSCSSLLFVQYFPGLPCLCVDFPGIKRRYIMSLELWVLQKQTREVNVLWHGGHSGCTYLFKFPCVCRVLAFPYGCTASGHSHMVAIPCHCRGVAM